MINPLIESMLNKYDPEYDVRPGPRISSVEMDLKNEIETLKRG